MIKEDCRPRNGADFPKSLPCACFLFVIVNLIGQLALRISRSKHHQAAEYDIVKVTEAVQVSILRRFPVKTKPLKK
jgi:hypothetical protein